MSEPYRGRPATSQIDGYSRYVSEDEATTEAAVVDGPTVEVQAYGEGALGEAIEAEDVKAFETRSEEHTSELQSLMRISYAVFCLKKQNIAQQHTQSLHTSN